MNLRRLAPVRGIVAALLAFVAFSATNVASAGMSATRHDDPAFQAAFALHAPVAHRVADEQRSQRRVPSALDLPFVADARRDVVTNRASSRPAIVERPIVTRAVPRAYDATAPPAHS